MNRHSKFYADLADYADDQDYYDEEEVEDYNEDERDERYYHNSGRRCDGNERLCYSDACMEAGHSSRGDGVAKSVPSPCTQSSLVDKRNYSCGGAGSEHASQNNVHVCISACDADYDLLDALLPTMHATWKAQAPTQLPLTEMEAVQTLREYNYDVDACVSFLQAKRAAHRSTRTRTLNIGQAVGERAAAAESDAVDGRRGHGSHEAATEIRANNNKEDISACADGPESQSTASATAVGEEQGKTASGEAVAPSKTFSTAMKTKSQQGESHLAHSNGKASTDDKTASHRPKGLQPDTNKPDCTFVIAGHVDAGKSTTLGHLLLLLGRVTQADVERNQREARRLNKESFKYAWLLDQSEEERRRGVTIDSGSFSFETEHRRVHILDAPGHKDYVLSMISSATQADAALLVVTAGTSEFENGLAHGTRDHLEVLKTLGVGSIVVVVNKMDSVNFSQGRFDHVVAELKLLFKQFRLKERVVVGYCPVSGMLGTNLVQVDHNHTPWYNGPSLLQLIDGCSLQSRLLDSPLRLSLQDVQGTVLYCKVESGRVGRGETVVFVPCNVKVSVKRLEKPTVAGAVAMAFAGETVEISTSSSLIGLVPGCVGCELNGKHPIIATSTDFEAQMQTFASLSRAILPGMTFTMIVHALTVTVKVVVLVSKMDRRTGEWSRGMVKAVPASTQAIVIFRAEHEIALEPAENCRALGRFVLHQNGETVAGGLVKRVLSRQT